MYYVVCITSALYHGNNAWFKKELLLSNCYALSSLPFLYHDHFWTPFNPKCNRVIRNMAEWVSGKNRMEDDFTRKNKSEIRNKMFLQKTLYFFVLSFDRQLCFCYNDWYFLIELWTNDSSISSFWILFLSIPKIIFYDTHRIFLIEYRLDVISEISNPHGWYELVI